MVSRGWGVILASGGVVAFLWVAAADARPVWKTLPSPPLQQRERVIVQPPAPLLPSQTPPAEEQAEAAAVPVISITIEDKRSRDEASSKGDPAAEQRDERDVIAQETMARTSQWQFWIGLAALLGLGVTIYFSIAATNAAVGGAKIAEDNFTITKLSMEAGDRAYVHHNGVSYISHAEAGSGRVLLAISSTVDQYWELSNSTDAYFRRVRASRRSAARQLLISYA